MKEITKYLSVKNAKSKKEIEYNIFCNHLYLRSNKSEAKTLFEYFKNDCEKVIGDYLEREQRLSSDFELIYMTAAMLVDDCKEINAIYNLGYKYYKGTNNPYDFSWFESENKNGKTVLQIMQDLYSFNKNFRNIFIDIFNCIENCCIKYHDTIDGIWSLQYILEY